jgi:hypothetical protein
MKLDPRHAAILVAFELARGVHPPAARAQQRLAELRNGLAERDRADGGAVACGQAQP